MVTGTHTQIVGTGAARALGIAPNSYVSVRGVLSPDVASLAIDDPRDVTVSAPPVPRDAKMAPARLRRRTRYRFTVRAVDSVGHVGVLSRPGVGHPSS